ncbi:PucR family transcriptional regulator [Saccharothrix deserti]|uniref:PucR family transcriptional regulator n=1 Tax=Saccharothrix deserti TaxID=2593674 RepID=UPI00131E983D|nr:PucR family transcriptional regulator ligand-binding domain-containing protein [Saccharothrix deserti]
MDEEFRAAGPARPGEQGQAVGALTVADVLALPVLAAGLPTVVTGESELDRPVRWVHITELTDPASFLKGGELVLTTGMPLPTDPSLVRRYVDELADVGASALVIELVRRFHRPPDALVRACRTRGLPLVSLAKDVNFVEITQVVHALILGNHAEAMRRTQQIHDAFTALTLRGAGPEDVMRAAAEMSGHTVVLENLAHQAVICEPAGRTVEDALTGWERRSRAVPPGDDTDVRGPEGWLVTPVEYRGERWGRVAMLPTLVPPAPGKPTRAARAFGPEDVTVLERTAMTLTIARLIHATTWERRAHRNLLQDIAEQRHRSPDEARVRAAALGLPTKDGRFLAVLVDTSAELETSLADALEPTFGPVLVGELSPGRVGVLLSPRPAQPWRPAVEQLSRTALDVDPSAVISVGSEVADLAHAARSFREAARVAEAVLPDSPGKPFHELSDIGLRQLLYTLREDVRVQDYVERQIGRLVEHDTRHHTDLLPTLRHYLDAAGNKTTAARRGDLSRQTLYQRLRAIERLLDCDLESGERRTELHVALMALGVLRLS